MTVYLIVATIENEFVGVEVYSDPTSALDAVEYLSDQARMLGQRKRFSLLRREVKDFFTPWPINTTMPAGT